MNNRSHRTLCIKCGKARATSKCGGCQEDFCLNDLVQHRQEMMKELEEIQMERDLFLEKLTTTMKNIDDHPMVHEIDRWERRSIRKINKMAEDNRKIMRENIKLSTTNIERDLERLSDEIRQNRQENDLFETDLEQWRRTLADLNKQLTKPIDATIHYDSSSSFIEKITFIPSESFEKSTKRISEESTENRTSTREDQRIQQKSAVVQQSTSLRRSLTTLVQSHQRSAVTRDERNFSVENRRCKFCGTPLKNGFFIAAHETRCLHNPQNERP